MSIMMIQILGTDLDGDKCVTGINPADISAIKKRPHGNDGCIIERISQPQFAIWSTEPVADVYAKLVAVGVKMEWQENE